MKTPVRQETASKLFVLFLVFVLLGLSACSPVSFSANKADDDQKGASCAQGQDCDGDGEVDTFRSVSETLKTANISKLDIIFVVDTSGSMDKERAALGQRLISFIDGLPSDVDWQICLTTTDLAKENGRFINFSNGAKVLNAQTSSVETVFQNSMNLPSGNGDERGVAALNAAVTRKDADCFRSGAAVASIVLSDEDERSTGGWDEFKTHTQYRALEAIDLPSNLVKAIETSFGRKKVFTSQSIVIKSGDQGCYDEQMKDSNVFFGRRYEELSKLTGGVIGTVCAADYAQQLGDFADRVTDSLSSVSLQCVPPEKPSVDIGSASSTVTWSGNKIFFSPALPAGSSVTVKYRCKTN
ncbi:MAG TPA: vWA domain-containing protein [Bdellovibrionales bacterium]|nr:vWA domain-containing protein [Bdellovibrionales bacterium]